MSNSLESSELTVLSGETTEPDGEDSKAPAGAGTPEPSISPTSRVKSELLDTMAVENALCSPSLQIKVKEVDITFLEDAFILLGDALDYEEVPSVEEEAAARQEDDQSLQAEPSYSITDEALTPSYADSSVYITTGIASPISDNVPLQRAVAGLPALYVEAVHENEEVSPSPLASRVFSLWRSQPSTISESVSAPQNGTELDTSLFVPPRRTVRPRLSEEQYKTIDVNRRFFHDWFETAASPVARMHQETSHKPDNDAGRASGPSSVAPSIDDVVIPQGYIMNDWLSGIQADIQDDNLGINENTVSPRRLAQCHRKMTRRTKHQILRANVATTL